MTTPTTLDLCTTTTFVPLHLNLYKGDLDSFILKHPGSQ